MSEELLALQKRLPDDLEWRTHPTHQETTQVESGVMGSAGERLQGLQVLFSVRAPADQRVGQSWALQLDQVRPGWGSQRTTLFRLELRHRPGIPADHHDAPHAHRLAVRIALPREATEWTWALALNYFCGETAIALPSIGHPLEDFGLKS